MRETLLLSMEPTLKAAVLSDLQDVPAQQRGAVIVFYMAIRRVAVCNQEAHDLLIDWIKTFDVRAFANQNVSKAALGLMDYIKYLTLLLRSLTHLPLFRTMNHPMLLISSE